MPFTLLSPYGPRYEINGLSYVGRDHACAIRPPDNLVSRVHACLWLDKGVVYVRDEGSSNGTFVNGTRLQPGQVRTLAPGDQVQFGETLFSLQGTPRAADFETLVEPPVMGTEPSAYAAPPYAVPPAPGHVAAGHVAAPTTRLPLSEIPPPPANYGAMPAAYGAAPAAPAAPRARGGGLSLPALLLGGCLGALTLGLCGVLGFFLTPIGREWLAGLFGGG